MKYLQLYFFSFLIFQVIGQQEIKILMHREQVVLEPIRILNTKFRECNLSVSPDGKSLFFMSTRPSKKNTQGGDGDLYRSNVGENNQWSAPLFLEKINTVSGEDEPSISSDGEYIYFQSWKNSWMNDDGPYFQSKMTKGSFSPPVGLGDGIGQFFRDMFHKYAGFGTDGMAISPDGNLFAVACGPDYYGQMDIYYSVKKDGKWTYPKIMGVSTAGDERALFIAADNSTIYFSSDGYGGYGGLDIFKTTIKDGKLGEIINLGAPFNTASDDQGFVITKNGNAAFLIRDLDIFYADLTALSDDIKPIDFDNEKLVEEKVTYIDSAKSVMKDLKKGNYTVNFEFNKFTLLPIYENIINEIATTHQFTQKIILTGHTDNVGSNSFNQNLSEQRVSHVEKLLRAKGFQNITVLGKGESNPLVPNSNQMKRAVNRRVEIVIE